MESKEPNSLGLKILKILNNITKIVIMDTLMDIKEYCKLMSSPWILISVTVFVVTHILFAPTVMARSSSPSICSYAEMYQPYQAFILMLSSPMLSYMLSLCGRIEGSHVFKTGTWQFDSGEDILINNKSRFRETTTFERLPVHDSFSSDRSKTPVSFFSYSQSILQDILRRLYLLNALLLQGTGAVAAVCQIAIFIIPRMLFEAHQFFVEFDVISILVLEIQLEILQKSPGRFLVVLYLCCGLLSFYWDECLCNMYFYNEVAAFVFVYMYFGGRLERLAQLSKNDVAKFSFSDYFMLNVPVAFVILIGNQHLLHIARKHSLREDCCLEEPPTLFGDYKEKFDKGIFFWS